MFIYNITVDLIAQFQYVHIR